MEPLFLVTSFSQSSGSPYSNPSFILHPDFFLKQNYSLKVNNGCLVRKSNRHLSSFILLDILEDLKLLLLLLLFPFWNTRFSWFPRRDTFLSFSLLPGCSMVAPPAEQKEAEIPQGPLLNPDPLLRGPHLYTVIATSIRTVYKLIFPS